MIVELHEPAPAKQAKAPRVPKEPERKPAVRISFGATGMIGLRKRCRDCDKLVRPDITHKCQI